MQLVSSQEVLEMDPIVLSVRSIAARPRKWRMTGVPQLSRPGRPMVIGSHGRCGNVGNVAPSVVSSGLFESSKRNIQAVRLLLER